MKNFLINLRGTLNGVKDLAGNIWTNNGVTVGDTELVTNGHAMVFANNSYLSIVGDDKFNIAEGQDFTLSVKVKISTMGRYYPLIIGPTPNGAEAGEYHQPCLCSSLAGNATPYYYYANGAYIVSSSNYTVNTITHIAVVRKNGIINLYLNGNKTATINNNSIQDFGRNTIGVGYDLLNPISHFNGEMDDLCLLNYAVWDSNFEPPTDYLINAQSNHIFNNISI